MQGRQVKIRPVRESDLPAILEIEEEVFPNPYPLGYLKFLLKGNPETFLAAERGSRLVGFVIADIRRGNEGHIISIAVRKEVRRNGIAKALIKAVDAEFKEVMVNVVRLEVRVSNTVAISLYRSLGYREEGVIRGYYRDGEDALRMSVRLS